MIRPLIIALVAAVLSAAIFARLALHEHDAAATQRARADGLQVARHADETGLRVANDGAREREVIYVDVVREVAAAGPVSPQCENEPAIRAAGAGTLRLRVDYCTRFPDRCAPGVVPRAGDGLPVD